MELFNPIDLVEIFAGWLEVLNRFWSTLNSPITDLFRDGFAPSVLVIKAFLASVGLSDLTLLEFMLGAGLGAYIIWQLVTWFLNLIT